jgi:hypothetical protein
MALKPAAVAQVARIDEAIAELQEKRNILMAHIRAEAKPGTDIIEFKGLQYVLKATPKTTLDTAKFIADHPYKEFPQYYKVEPVFSAPKVKAEDRKGYEVAGTTSISIAKVEKEG